MSAQDIGASIARHLADTPTSCQNKGVHKFAAFYLSSSQRPLFLLTGYAGTGKTTFINAIVKFLGQTGYRSVLIAPTGRAAKVMSSYTQKKAWTIHKRIYTLKINDDGYNQLEIQPNFHKKTFFIVDEASMIGDTSEGLHKFRRNLLSDLVEYVNSGKNCFLIMVGDKAQLPPVGSIFSPALDAEVLSKNYGFDVYHTHFTTVVRQQKESGILANATALRYQLSHNICKTPFFKLEDHNDIVKVSGPEFKEILEQAYMQNDLSDVIILCRSNKRANLYNKQIRYMILFREDVIAAGDLLMVVKNNYTSLPEGHSAGFIANGDIIEIMRINRFYSLYGFDFADVTIRMVDYPDDISFETTIILNTIDSEGPSLGIEDSKKLFDEILKDYEDISTKKEKAAQLRQNNELHALQVKFAYAITTHKAQGGQWQTVFIDYGFLKKEHMDSSFLRWLYTASTRAIDKLYLVNFDNSFFDDH